MFHKPWIGAAGTISVIVAVTLMASAHGGRSAATKIPTAGDTYKNIQVLKSLPADQLMPVMMNWSQALGVRCSFCHEQDFSKDTKRAKGAARTMFLMVKRINANEPAVGSSVTCFMCHHGQTEPAQDSAHVRKAPASGAEGEQGRRTESRSSNRQPVNEVTGDKKESTAPHGR